MEYSLFFYAAGLLLTSLSWKVTVNYILQKSGISLNPYLYISHQKMFWQFYILSCSWGSAILEKILWHYRNIEWRTWCIIIENKNDRTPTLSTKSHTSQETNNMENMKLKHTTQIQKYYNSKTKTITDQKPKSVNNIIRLFWISWE